MADTLLSSSQRKRGFPWFAALAVVLTALGAAGGWGVMYLLGGRHQTLRGTIALLVFAAIYGAATLAFGVPEARALAGRLRRR